MNCFERVGMKVPDKRGGKCPCGVRVRFDLVSKRMEHFMECPKVAARIAKAQETLELGNIEVTEESLLAALQQMNGALDIDVKAVALARRLTEHAFG